MAVKQLERYPVDLYYLVDVSASMQENLDHVGVKNAQLSLSESMQVHFRHFLSGKNGFLLRLVLHYDSSHLFHTDQFVLDIDFFILPSHALPFPSHPVSTCLCFLSLLQLKTVGVALSLRMMEHSSDLWMGFGSFVDKPVSPYINVHASKINNPCRYGTESVGRIGLSEFS